MAKRFGFIVAYTDNYIDGITALKNSINIYNPNCDIIIHHGDSVEDTAIKRFDIAVKEGPKYDAICLMDADMFLTSDCTLFFELASSGFIVTGSNGMVIDFNNGYQDRYGIELEKTLHLKTHTTAPIFLSKNDLDWFDRLYNSRRIDHWDDFLYLNILGMKMGKCKKMLCMPPYAFTGIHHWMVKPETSARMAGESLISGTEEIIYMVHGKWWDEAWVNDLDLVMSKYFIDNDMGAKCKQRTTDAIKLLKEQFEEYKNGRILRGT
jgi:hypothetical protein